MMSFPFSSAASFLLRPVFGNEHTHGIAVLESAFSPCQKFMSLEMELVAELLVWDGLFARLLV